MEVNVGSVMPVQGPEGEPIHEKVKIGVGEEIFKIRLEVSGRWKVTSENLSPTMRNLW